MNILTFSPYGMRSPGQTNLYLLMRYLKSYSSEIIQLHCNGAFTVCDRDTSSSTDTFRPITSRGRTIEHCLRCSSEQREQAQFAGANIKKLTGYLNSDDLERTRKWVLQRDSETLWNSEWFGLSLSNSIKDTFYRLSGESLPSFQNKNHSAIVRRLSLVSIRMAVAMGRCINRERPDWVFLSSAQEVLTQTAMHVIRDSNSAFARFEKAPDKNTIHVYRGTDKLPYSLETSVSSLINVRASIETWPKELIQELDDFLGFLGISLNQLGLPVAK